MIFDKGITVNRLRQFREFFGQEYGTAVLAKNVLIGDGEIPVMA